MTKSEIKSRLLRMESAGREKERHRAAFNAAEVAEHEARRDLDGAFCELTGARQGIVMVDGTAYSFGGMLGIHPVPVVDLGALLDPDVSDARCVKSINPDLDPADLSGIACGEVS